MSVFNGLSRPCCWGAVAIAGLMIAGPQPAVAIQAGINVDIHQDINQVASLPNGFYIWGRLESGVPLGMPGGGSWSRPPVLLEHIDGYPPNVFPNFAYNISPDLTMPGQNWYTFWARWSYPSGTHYIPYCQVYHIGVLFDLVCHNVVIDAQGRWERNGSPVTVGLNQGFVPAPGFRVDDQVDTQFIRIQNGDADGLMEPGEIEGAIVQMDLVSIPSREELEMLLGTDPFRELHLGGLQSSLPWVPVMQDMDPISELNPVDFWPDSFFDVFLEVSTPGGIWPQMPVPVMPGGFLIARERVQFRDNNNVVDYRWVWEMHEAHHSDLGDAPDSTNSWGVVMTTYPWGVQANYPTVYLQGSPPHGPIHLNPNLVAFLGANVSAENEADIMWDQDGVNNIQPQPNLADQDQFDDGVVVPLALPTCVPTSFRYTVTVPPPPPWIVAAVPLYVNVWFDWDRNGDWDGTFTCPDGSQAPEWAVQNQALGALLPGVYIFNTPNFLPWNPPSPEPMPIWMRITLSEQQWQPTGGLGDGGSGPAIGYQYGETEDYYFYPEVQTTEACCLPTGECLDVTVDRCLQLLGVPQGAGTVCTLPEGCCLPDGTCVMVDPICCDDMGGVRQGPGSACSQPEACCITASATDPRCVMADPLCCDELGGIPQGPGTVCSEPEACCLPDGSCTMIDPICCDDLGGIPQGAGTVCSQPEACCITSMTTDPQCVMADPLCCDELGGVPQGPGTVCSQPEACCLTLDGGGCVDVDPLCCDELGGVPQGAGTACSANTIPCCLDGGAVCRDVDPLCCDELGGFQGYASQCLGDLNGNGIDDACEQEVPEHDLGDAPDATNSFPAPMTAYPWAVLANFPTVYQSGSPPFGPIHMRPQALAFLGHGVSLENEADIGLDQDPTNNIIPPANTPDLDLLDDGVLFPLSLPHCQPTRFQYIVTLLGPGPSLPLYVNVWFDWNRDGDWDDTLPCDDTVLAPEWAVQNQVLAGLVIGPNLLTTTRFLPWHQQPIPERQPIWMRITLSEQPWQPQALPGSGGCGPAAGYEFGETEDYYIEDYEFIPYATLTGAKSVGSLCDIDLLGGGGGGASGAVTEPRARRIDRIRFSFDVPPGLGVPLIEETTTLTWPLWGPYTGAALINCGVAGNDLICTFAPKLENARTYRFTLGPAQGITLNPAVVLGRGLVGDVNSDGITDGTDRAVVIGVWTGSGWSCQTDLNEDGATNGTDRAIVIGSWTSGSNTAP